MVLRLCLRHLWDMNDDTPVASCAQLQSMHGSQEGDGRCLPQRRQGLIATHKATKATKTRQPIPCALALAMPGKGTCDPAKAMQQRSMVARPSTGLLTIALIVVAICVQVRDIAAASKRSAVDKKQPVIALLIGLVGLYILHSS